MMVGRRVSAPVRVDGEAAGQERMLAVRDLVRLRDTRRVLDGISFDVAKGEILGLAGVSGNGQDELFECLCGLVAPDEGSVTLADKPLHGLSVAEVAAEGVGYVPSDRFRDGLVADLTVSENLVLGQHWQGRWRRGPFLDRGALDANARRAIETYSIAAGGPDSACRKLSGGNAQKVILAREFTKASKLLLCNQPTRGLDVGAIEFVHRELVRKRDEGCAVLLASEELEDLFALCNRIGVMFRGRLLAILDARSATQEEVGRLMAGQESAGAA
jgi:simple sugar transport system ATP-binding protein